MCRSAGGPRGGEIVQKARGQRFHAGLLPKFTTEAVMAWLDAGQPDPEQAAERIAQAVHGVIQAAQAA